MPDQTLFESNDAPKSGGFFARVVVERGLEGGPGESGLTYRCVEGEPPALGERVQVPLGRSGKLAGGVVVCTGGEELLEGFDASRVKVIAKRTGSVVPPGLLDLATWMASYYVCPLGMVLASVVPSAVKHQTGARVVELVRVSPGAERDPGVALKPAARRAWERVLERKAAESPIVLSSLVALVEAKSARPIRELIEAKLLMVERAERVEARALASLGATSPETPLSLTDAQRGVVAGVGASLDRFGVHLLRGVTGSGKTEVYLRLIERVLDAGKSAIVLVPEISLTPQTAGRFTRRFPGGIVAVLHSGLTPAQRHREWARTSGGEARVVVGARSAIFAPLSNLGLIVVDEEHDSSYKQDQLPRYNARDVAIKRAQLSACPAVLGSATPSLESWANAAGGRSTLWELPSRVVGVLPPVTIVDMREERRRRRADPAGEAGRLHLLGPTLELALEETLHAGGQAILLLNRRGLAQRLACRSSTCGFVLGCDQCDANLVLHKAAASPGGTLVRCHHCLGELKVPVLCPACGDRISVLGGGTQRLEDELTRKFASMGIEEGRTMLRLDSDTMRSAGDYFAALDRFGRGEIRVMLGTQMIAKGLDFPNVRLVGVVDADTALSIPDFRAGERTFQLVSQVAGRAGRGAHAGRVVVQTYCPDDPAVALAAMHDYRAFAHQELESRVRAGLPPATRMARIVCRDADATRASARAREIGGALRRLGEGRVRVDGPFVCTLSRVAGFHRQGIDIVGDRAGAVQDVLARARSEGWIKSDAATAIDVDPVALL